MVFQKGFDPNRFRRVPRVAPDGRSRNPATAGAPIVEMAPEVIARYHQVKSGVFGQTGAWGASSDGWGSFRSVSTPTDTWGKTPQVKSAW